MNTLKTCYQHNEILILTMLVLSALADLNFLRPVSGTNKEIA
jgi:hypothetical protein